MLSPLCLMDITFIIVYGEVCLNINKVSFTGIYQYAAGKEFSLIMNILQKSCIHLQIHSPSRPYPLSNAPDLRLCEVSEILHKPHAQQKFSKEPRNRKNKFVVQFNDIVI